MLLDTNILIYSCKPGGEWLSRWTEANDASVSAISRLEALGYHSIDVHEEKMLQNLFAVMVSFAVDEEIIGRATILRRLKKIGTADVIIAATALEYGVPLVTRNVADFRHIPGLKVINPFDTPS